MRNRLFSLSLSLLFVSVTTILFQSCVKDNCTSHYYYWEPVYKTKAEAKANIKSNAAREIERPGKIYIRGNYIFLNEIDKGIHIIDNSNPSSPRNIAFIDIPGNIDLAVKGNVLYADFFTDMVAIDITNPQQVAVTKFTDNLFPERSWGYGFAPLPGMVITEWIKRDTIVTIDCGGNNGLFNPMKSRSDIMFFSSQSSGGLNNATASPFGVGGSMARFTVINNYLYGVSESLLNVVSIADAANPVFSNTINIGGGIETIYPFNNRLFIGSNTGMVIYDIANPANPVRQSSFSHARSCDPVIADNYNAFVTLRSGTACLGFTNQLDVLDITNINAPLLKASYPMTNPHGLAKDENILIICDGKAGLKFYNAANISNIALLKTINGIEAFDVIAQNKWALVVAKDGLYQYDYTSTSNIKLLSKLTIQK
jgi:hypothetical protein